MTRLNLALLAALFACALALVTSTHHSRRLFTELERGQDLQKRIEVEWGQLQLEQSTWAKHALVETIARRQLGMRAPDSRRLQFVTPPERLK
ncbi:MAG: cell division protein FtsL [Burkholderiales bacterium]